MIQNIPVLYNFCCDQRKYVVNSSKSLMISMNMNFTWKQAETISPGQVALQGIELATKTWGQFVKFVIVAALGMLGIVIIMMILGAILPASLTGLISFILFTLFSLAVGVGGIRLALAVVDGKKLSVKEIFAFDAKLIGVAIIAYVLYLLAVAIGLVVLVIPGIMIAIGCSFTLFTVVDKKDIGPVQALKASWAITNGDLLSIALLSSAMTLIAYIAILPAYEIFAILLALSAFFASVKLAVVGGLLLGLVGIVLSVALLCWVVLVMIGSALSYAIAYRKLSQTRSSAMEAAMRS
jgi:hypothetical protein